MKIEKIDEKQQNSRSFEREKEERSKSIFLLLKRGKMNYYSENILDPMYIYIVIWIESYYGQQT